MANKFFTWLNKIINDEDIQEQDAGTEQQQNCEGSQVVEDTPTPTNEQHSVPEESETPLVEEPAKPEINQQEEPERKKENNEEKIEKEIMKEEKKVVVEKVEEEKVPTLPSIKGANAIEKLSNLIQIIVSQVKSDYRGIDISLQNHTLLVVVTDGILYSIVNNENFKNQLQQTITNECDCCFGGIKLSNQLPEGGQMREIAQQVYYDVKSQVYEHGGDEVRRAKITAVQGSLKTAEVILDSGEITQLQNARYNIGAMSQPFPIRTNQIAIDESDEAQSQYNKYVSREHAYIAYNEQDGFLLFADKGGVREQGKRTHILRNNELIEIEGILVPKVLRNGDIIVLTKKVYLKFEIL